MMEGLRQQVLSVNELLRHFWHGFPVNSKARANKLQRVVSALHQLYDQSNAMLAAAAPAERGYVSQVLQPSMRAMDVALSRFDEHADRVKALMAA